MTQSLADYLAERNADRETVHQAARYYLAEKSGDVPADEMKAELIGASADQSQVDEALHEFETDPGLMERAALAILSGAWDDPDERARVISAIENAEGKLPIIEVGLLAIVVLYGLYLQRTGGVKESETVVERTASGDLRTTVRTEFFGVGSVLANVVGMFGQAGRPPG
jgi:hypothetical protein